MTSTVLLEKNNVFAALTKTLASGKFHWMIYVIGESESKQGWKVHATDTLSADNSFEFRCTQWQGPFSEEALLFVKIGHIDKGLDVNSLVEYVKDIPMEVPMTDIGREPRFSCRVWFKEAIRILDNAGLFVQCSDIDALEKELYQKAMATVILKAGARDFQFVTSIARNARAWPEVV